MTQTNEHTPAILIVLGSTRQSRQGEVVARWITERAGERLDARFELIDLKDWPLPFIQNPVPPAMGHYDDTTQMWADKVGAADGFIFVTPEYNHGYPAVLKNALDHIYAEWGYKPATIVSYGIAAGGYRASEQLRQVLIELRMVPVRDQVGISPIFEAFDEHGRARDKAVERMTVTMLDELVWWAGVLRSARMRRYGSTTAA
jgi:NAD(P)H-dependent FMN reductase